MAQFMRVSTKILIKEVSENILIRMDIHNLDFFKIIQMVISEKLIK